MVSDKQMGIMMIGILRLVGVERWELVMVVDLASFGLVINKQMCKHHDCDGNN